MSVFVILWSNRYMVVLVCSFDFVIQLIVCMLWLMLCKLKLEDQYWIVVVMQDIWVVCMLILVLVFYVSDDVLDWIRSWEVGDMNGWVYVIIFDVGVLEGCIIIEWWEVGDCIGWYFGYWLLLFYWGDGYMIEVVSVVIECFFGWMMGEMLFVGVIVDNLVLFKVQDKLGFQVMGMSDVYLYFCGVMVLVIDIEVMFGLFMLV